MAGLPADVSVEEALHGYENGPVKEAQQGNYSPVKEVLVVTVALVGLLRLFFCSRNVGFWDIGRCDALSGSAFVGGCMREF